MLSKEAVEHFHTFWGNAPFPVMLIHKDRSILERNKAAEGYTDYTPGTRCADFGTKETHQGCLADIALQEGAARHAVNYVEYLDQVLDTYWIPLEGYENLFVHFAIDVTGIVNKEDYKANACSKGCAACGGH